MLNSIQHYNLDITRSAFIDGEKLFDYMDAFDVDLFLSKEEEEGCSGLLIPALPLRH